MSTPPDPDRVQPLVAVGAVAALVVVFGIVLWATGAPPFDSTPPEPAAAIPTSQTQPPTTVQPPTTTRRQFPVQFQIEVFDNFDWDENANFEGDRCVAVNDVFSVRSGVNVVVRDSSTQEVVAIGALSSGAMWIEPGMDDLPDRDLDLFWRCVFTTRFDAGSLTPDGVYQVGIEDTQITFSGTDLLNGDGIIVYFDVDLESERELIRIGG